MLHDLMRSFELESPSHSPNPPAWDLVKVLNFLRNSVFEPLTSRDLRTVAMKVLFLLSLATVKRVSELQALSRKVAFRGNGISLSSIYIYIPWPFPPVWGVADNTKEQQKQWGPHSVPLAMTRDPAEFGWHCWSNTAHPPPSSTT